MSPRRRASRTASSLFASSRERYGDQPSPASINSTSTSAAYGPSRTNVVWRLLFIASSEGNRRPSEPDPADGPSPPLPPTSALSGSPDDVDRAAAAIPGTSEPGDAEPHAALPGD